MSELTHCFHCSAAILPGIDLNVVIDGQPQPMCCRGCGAVCQTILDAGLQDYYSYRTVTADTPGVSRDDIQMYDAPEIIETFSVCTNKLWDSRLSISGLHCTACAWLIEKKLAHLIGVKSIDVHLQNGIARICWDDKQVSISEIIRAIDSLGYFAEPYSASSRERQLQQQSDALLSRLGIAGIGMMQVVMVAIALYAGDFQDISQPMRNLLRYFSLAITTPVLLYAAQPFFIGAARNLRALQLGIDVPVALALSAAYIASVLATIYEHPHVYFDTINMFVFFLLLSRYLHLLAKKNQSGGGGVLPISARVIDASNSNQVRWTASSVLSPGNTVIVMPGETIPADGIVCSGQSSVDESSFTGEYKPRATHVNDSVMGGTYNIDGTLHIKVSSSPATCKISYIDRLLEQALQSKPQVAKIADRIAEKFVLIVLLISAATFAYWFTLQAENAFTITLAVLVVSCPCALSLATPATYTAAINCLRKSGIVVANAEVFEHAQKISHAVFDKTGTLTAGKPQLEKIVCTGEYTEPDILQIAAGLEQHSNHPISKAFEDQPVVRGLVNINVFSGRGIEANLGEDIWRIGSAEFCSANEDLFVPGPKHSNASGLNQSQIIIYLCKNNQVAAQLQLVDSIRTGAGTLINDLRKNGIAIHILSGDRLENVAEVAGRLGVHSFRGSCSPGDKLQYVKNLQQQGHTVLMVGDGVNDAPVVAGADISVALTNASALTRAQADVCLLTEDINSLQQLLDKAVATRRILMQNFGWALTYNLLTLPLAAMGYIPPYLAALGMSASSILVVLNATRLYRPGAAQPVYPSRPLPWQLTEGDAASG